MTKNIRIVVIFIVALVVVVGVVSVLHALRPADAKMEAYVKEALPLVEKEAGRKFKSMPAVRVVSAEALVPILTRELAPRMSVLAPAGHTGGSLETARTYARALSKHLVGKYGFHTKVLYIVPENVKRIKEATGQAVDEDAIIKLTVTHELTHVLQDQHMDLGRLENGATTLEQAYALNALIEGQAQYVEEKLAETQHLGKSYDQFTRAIGSIGAGSGDTAVDQISRVSGRMVSDLYLRGKDFVAWNYSHGGPDQVWRILAAPPVKTSVILHPETYSNNSSRAVDYALVLKGVAAQLGKLKTAETCMEVGEMQLQAMYQSMDPSHCDRLLSKLEHAHTVIVGTMPSIANVSVMVFRDSSLMSQYLTDLEAMARKNVATMNKSSSLRISKPVFSKFGLLKSDASSKIAFTVSEDNEKYVNTFVRVVRGRAMVEMYVQSLPVSDADFAKVAETVFSKLPKDVTAKAQ